jgi:hypothetical protein
VCVSCRCSCTTCDLGAQLSLGCIKLFFILPFSFSYDVFRNNLLLEQIIVFSDHSVALCVFLNMGNISNDNLDHKS